MSLKLKFIFFDLETTGLGKKSEICQIGAVSDFDNHQFGIYIIPQGPIHYGASGVNHLYKRENELYFHDEKVAAVSPEDGLNKFMDYLLSYQVETDDKIILVAHNGFRFDAPVLINNLLSVGFEYEKIAQKIYGFVDTLKCFRTFFPGLASYTLQNLKSHFGLKGGVQHEAVEDAADLWNLIKIGLLEANAELDEFLMEDFKNLREIKL